MTTEGSDRGKLLDAYRDLQAEPETATEQRSIKTDPRFAQQGPIVPRAIQEVSEIDQRCRQHIKAD